MKTYKQFMEQFSGYVTGSTNSRAGATMAKRASNASAAEKADKKSEKIVAATNREAKPVKPLGEDDRALDPSNVHEPKKNKLSEANRGAMAMRLANKRASQIKRNEAQREKQQKNVQARKSRIGSGAMPRAHSGSFSGSSQPVIRTHSGAF